MFQWRSALIADTQPHPADLKGDPASPWAGIEVPAGWEPVARLAEALESDVDSLAEEIVRQIRRDVPVYQGPTVPLEDLRGSVLSNTQALLAGLAGRALPSPAELRDRAELGRRRALQGHPIDAVIRAYHIGYQETWRRLVAAVREQEMGSTDLLLDAAQTLWAWLNLVTGAIVDTYTEAQRSQEAEITGLQIRFLSLVLSGDTESEECQALARTVGLAPKGVFHAIQVNTDAPASVVRLAARGRATGVVIQHGQGHVVVVQGDRDVGREHALIKAAPDARLGAGLVRSGLEGLRKSIIDAERAAAIAPGPGTCVPFADAWVEATVAASLERLEPLISGPAAVARRHPHLAQAVLAFASSGSSLAGAARQLMIDPSTLAYRLSRWQQLTGLDPRTHCGLSQSFLCLTLIAARH
jgi:DNA-binding PucR family transcriptional regulator